MEVLFLHHKILQVGKHPSKHCETKSTWGRRSLSRRGELWIIPEGQDLCPSALTHCGPAGLTAVQGTVTDTLTDFGGLRAKHLSAKM